MNKLPNHISYLERKQIDEEKWDQCIRQAVNGLIYGNSFYLDTMSENWRGLVLDDYSAVMPLTWNRKYGIDYLYQPPFTPQLGLFFAPSAGPAELTDFLDLAKSKFRFCEIHLNFLNKLDGGVPRANYILDLNPSYKDIRKGYKKRLLENLGEAESYELVYLPSTAFTTTIQLFKQLYGKRLVHVRNNDYSNFEKLCKILAAKTMLFVREIRDTEGELLNSSIFLQDSRRIYNIMSVSPSEGREKRAHFFLLDQVIREFAQRPLLFDFEGSEVPGIAEFYRKFGGGNQSYYFLKYNHLPFPIRLFK